MKWSKTAVDIFKTIQNNEIANRFAKVFSVDVLVKGSIFLLLPIYLHLMTQDEVGTFNYIFAFIQTMSIVFNFGLYPAQSKLYHDYKGNDRGNLLFSINFILVTFLAVILIPSYCLGLDLKIINFIFDYPIPYQAYRFPILLGVLSSVGSYILLNFLLTSENIKKVQQYNLLRMFISNGIVVSILCYSKGDHVLTRLTTYYLCETILWLYFSMFYIKEFRLKIKYGQLKRILSISLPVFSLSIISTIQGFSDKFFIQQKTDMAVMAIYTTSVIIASVCGLIIISFQNVWLPIFLKEKNIEENYRKTKKMANIIVFTFSIIAVCMILGIKLLLMFNIIPSTYDAVIWILPFLFAAQIISAVNALYGNYFLYFERMVLGSIVGGCLGIVCFFLNFFFIPRFGVTGAIVSLLVGNIIWLTTVHGVVSWLYHQNKNKIYRCEPFDYTVVVSE